LLSSVVEDPSCLMDMEAQRVQIWGSTASSSVGIITKCAASQFVSHVIWGGGHQWGYSDTRRTTLTLALSGNAVYVLNYHSHLHFVVNRSL